MTDTRPLCPGLTAPCGKQTTSRGVAVHPSGEILCDECSDLARELIHEARMEQAHEGRVS